MSGVHALLTPPAARRWAASLVMISLGFVAVDCGKSSPPTATSAQGVYGVGTRSETLLDERRTTDARGDQPAKATRTLVTQLFYPADGPTDGDPVEGAPPARSVGPFPLIVFAHGSTVTPALYAPLLESWARAGYVVAAPTFPLSSTQLPGAASDLVNQPADVTFVITEILRLSADGSWPLAGRVDADRIGVAGHSLGAMTALAVTFNSCCVDKRIKAAVVLAGAESHFAGTYFSGTRTPILVVHGDADGTVPISEGQRIYADAPPPKAMLTVLGGDHSEPYAGGRTRVTARAVMVTTEGFFARYLKGRTGALDQLRTQVRDDYPVRFEMSEG